MKRSLPRGILTPWLLTRNWSISAKLSVALLLSALIPMILIASVNLWQSLQSVEKTAERNLELFAVSIAQRLDQLMEDNRVAVKQIGGDSEVKGLLMSSPDQPDDLRSSVVETFVEILYSNPFYEYVYLMDRQGDTLVSRQLEGLPSIEGKNFQDRAYFREAMAGTPYIDVLVGRSSKRLGFYFSTPVQDTGGEIIGVAIIKLQGEAITEVINAFNRESETSFAFLVDQDGVIVSHPNESWVKRSLIPLTREAELRVGQRFVLDGCTDAENLDDCRVESLAIPELEGIIESAEPGHVSYVWPDDGGPDAGAGQIVGYAATENLGWVVGVNEASAEFKAPLTRLYRQSGITVLVVALIVILVALRLAWGIARPIGRLAQAAQDVEEGQPFEPEDIADVTALGDEVGHLARVFSDMVLALRARMAELHTVYEIGQDITATLEVEETLQAILDRVRDVVAYDAAEITLFDRQENALVVATWSGGETFRNTQGKRYKLGEGFTGHIGQARQSLLVPDIQAEMDRKAVAEQLADDVPVRSLLGVPLLIRDRLVGTLGLVDNRVGAFDEHDQRLLETIAPQAAIAIEKAQQVREREQRLKSQIEQLRIEIDEVKREREVAAIVSTDYFQSLRQKAHSLRSRAKGKRAEKTNDE